MQAEPIGEEDRAEKTEPVEGEEERTFLLKESRKMSHSEVAFIHLMRDGKG